MLHDFTRDSKLQNRVQRSQFYRYSELYRYSCDEAFKNVFNLIFNLIVFFPFGKYLRNWNIFLFLVTSIKLYKKLL